MGLSSSIGMTKQPPDTYIYADPANFELWRDINDRYVEFCTVDEIPEKQKAFVAVLKDVLGRLGELEIIRG